MYVKGLGISFYTISLNSGGAGNFNNSEGAASLSPVRLYDRATQAVATGHKCLSEFKFKLINVPYSYTVSSQSL